MPGVRCTRQFQHWAKGLRLSCLIPGLTFPLVAAQTSWNQPSVWMEAASVSSASLTCALIALSISDANLVLFPEAFD